MNHASLCLAGAALHLVISGMPHSTAELAGLEKPSYATSYLVLDEELQDVWTADVSGDGLDDIVVSVWSAARARELLIYHQTPEGRFRSHPTTRVEIKRDIVAFDLADVRDEPGLEIILWTRTGGFSYSTQHAGYAGNAVRIIAQDFLCDVPDRKKTYRLDASYDFDVDGEVEFLLPGPDGYTLFGRAAAVAGAPDSEGTQDLGKRRRFVRRARFDTGLTRKRPRGPGSTRLEFKVDRIAFDQRREYAGLVIDAADDGGRSEYLELERWLPAPGLRDFNGDGRVDVLFVWRTSARGYGLELWLQRPDGGFSQSADWEGPVDGGGALWSADADADGRSDVLVAEPRDAEDPSLRIYRARPDGSFGKKPDQLLKFSGYGLRVDLADVRGSGNEALLVSSYQIPLTGALRGGRVDRSLLCFERRGSASASHGSNVYERRPVSKWVETFTAKEFRGIGQRQSFEADLTGTGQRVLLAVEREGALVARRFGEDLEIDDEVFWSYLPTNWVLRFDVVRLDGDRISDLILRHHGALTILTSEDR